jgi:hypothetical protein
MRQVRAKFRERTSRRRMNFISRATYVAVLVAGALVAWCAVCPEYSAAAQSVHAAGGSDLTWHFAVSGDSRNCGDVVMPAIAAGAVARGAAFYWHLGDFRALFQMDEDIAGQTASSISKENYEKESWSDFVRNQLRPFGRMPVFLAIGNHELIHHTRADYIAKFERELSIPQIVKQRLADDPSSTAVRTYYHWIERGIDFITMDNASDDQFDAPQMAWFERVLEKAERNPGIRAIVVGMHKALPDSISLAHSMSESGKNAPIESGRQVYRELANAQNDFHKKVYILASHSHFYMDGIFNTEYWKDSVLPGWIVGTAGAERHQLPDAWRNAHRALQGVHGYMLATVNPEAENGGPADGTIRFEFHLINKSDLPEAVRKRFTPKLIDFCFDQNMRKPE